MEEKIRLSVCALIICNGALLIVKRSATDGFMPNAWDFPGGGVEKGETLVSALIREVKEEINVDISNADIELIGVSEEISQKEEIKHEIQFNYEIVLESRVPVRLNSEHSAYDWIDKCDDSWMIG
ncbi:MAG: NUDIX hydrolase [Alphaproteobacteria bacterium]|nr:NUDIX hydrolase [Alphaproteobacteria bacterium]